VAIIVNDIVKNYKGCYRFRSLQEKSEIVITLIGGLRHEEEIEQSKIAIRE
jgi:hypothetical protein